uniref:Uncharacterized protein n=1 Tax=Oryza nivara TaxID=4536 RepID=A0A0E0J940_ORYNI
MADLDLLDQSISRHPRTRPHDRLLLPCKECSGSGGVVHVTAVVPHQAATLYRRRSDRTSSATSSLNAAGDNSADRVHRAQDTPVSHRSAGNHAVGLLERFHGELSSSNSSSVWSPLPVTEEGQSSEATGLLERFLHGRGLGFGGRSSGQIPGGGANSRTDDAPPRLHRRRPVRTTHRRRSQLRLKLPPPMSDQGGDGHRCWTRAEVAPASPSPAANAGHPRRSLLAQEAEEAHAVARSPPSCNHRSTACRTRKPSSSLPNP